MDPNANLKEQSELLAHRRADGSLSSYDRYRLYDWIACPEASQAYRVWRG
jgi:hypothetical protein